MIYLSSLNNLNLSFAAQPPAPPPPPSGGPYGAGGDADIGSVPADPASLPDAVTVDRYSGVSPPNVDLASCDLGEEGRARIR